MGRDRGLDLLERLSSLVSELSWCFCTDLEVRGGGVLSSVSLFTKQMTSCDGSVAVNIEFFFLEAILFVLSLPGELYFISS